MPTFGFGWADRPVPPGSTEVAEATLPYYGHVLDCFGAERCMFESNFPGVAQPSPRPRATPPLCAARSHISSLLLPSLFLCSSMLSPVCLCYPPPGASFLNVYLVAGGG